MLKMIEKMGTFLYILSLLFLIGCVLLIYFDYLGFIIRHNMDWYEILFSYFNSYYFIALSLIIFISGVTLFLSHVFNPRHAILPVLFLYALAFIPFSYIVLFFYNFSIKKILIYCYKALKAHIPKEKAPAKLFLLKVLLVLVTPFQQFFPNLKQKKDSWQRKFMQWVYDNMPKMIEKMGTFLYILSLLFLIGCVLLIYFNYLGFIVEHNRGLYKILFNYFDYYFIPLGIIIILSGFLLFLSHISNPRHAILPVLFLYALAFIPFSYIVLFFYNFSIKKILIYCYKALKAHIPKEKAPAKLFLLKVLLVLVTPFQQFFSDLKTKKHDKFRRFSW